MRLLIRIVKIVVGIVFAAFVGLLIWLYTAPPELLRVGSGYAAKIVCSNVFLAGRDADAVLSEDVQAPGNPLLRLMRVSVDRPAKRVHAALLGNIAGSDAVYRDGLGCAVVQAGVAPAAIGVARTVPAPKDAAAAWPEGEGTGASAGSDAKVAALLGDPQMAGSGMRAIVVVRGGRIVGETYGAGFSKDTPLLGWSMAKSVNAMVIGALMREGKLSLEDRKLFPQWQNDQRGDLTLAELLAMESGLAFDEGYATVADATRMLFLEPDMAGFAADQPLIADPGTRFNYSSGTGVLLSKIWMSRLGGEALAYPEKALFAPLGIRSATFEADAAGTFVGSSYLYATARDWARLGLLLARDGVWNGNRILPEGFVAGMQAPNKTSNGRYSKMQTWLPKDPDLPADTFIFSGHDGQSVVVVPSLDLVVVRLGLTPSRFHYRPTQLVGEIAKIKTAP